MQAILPLVGIGLIYSLIIFYLCEEKSLKHKKLSELKQIEYDVEKVFVSFEKYQTLRYAGYYFLSVLIYTLIIGKITFVAHHLGLLEVLSYTFLTALLGSTYIILFKWRKDLLIKIFSSFMYGSIFIAATGIGFALVYLIGS